MGAVMILANLHPRVHEVRTQWTRRDLQTQAIERHGIILALLAILLFTQDFIQIDTGNGNKRRSLLLDRHREAGIVGRNTDCDACRTTSGGTQSWRRRLARPQLRQANDNARPLTVSVV